MKKEETKAYILEKVSPIFNKQGYVGTSMSSLEEATGMKKPALYGMWVTKTSWLIRPFV